jgi:hypothetical protein
MYHPQKGISQIGRHRATKTKKFLFGFGKWFNGQHVQVQNKESGNRESSNKSQSIDRD